MTTLSTPASRTRLSHRRLHDQILGCWTGKNIGGTLGGPFEGRTEILDVTGYVTPAGEPLPNDDLDLQLVWLRALQDRGPSAADARVLGEYWLTYVTPHWNEYGVSKANQRIGLAPPLSGTYANEHWKHSNGAWIRSEIWACLAPGAPDVAAGWAYQDACVDHGDGEGTWAAMFTAALQSTAFVCSDVHACVRSALERVPPSSRLAAAVTTAVRSHAEGIDWTEARRRVLDVAGHLGWFQAPANVAFTVIGLLYGAGDLGRSLLTAVNCGDDTDCTGATVGATLGILHGRSALPDEWTSHIGDRILTVAIERGNFRAPKTVGELTEHVIALTPRMLAHARLASEVTTDLDDHETCVDIGAVGSATRALWTAPAVMAHADLIHTAVTLEIDGMPVVEVGDVVPVRLRFQNLMNERRDLSITWFLPAGWSVRPGVATRVSVESRATSIHAVEAALGTPPPIWPPQTEAVYEIVAGPLTGTVERGIVQIVADGRPTVGSLPITFVAAATRALPARIAEDELAVPPIASNGASTAGADVAMVATPPG